MATTTTIVEMPNPNRTDRSNNKNSTTIKIQYGRSTIASTAEDIRTMPALSCRIIIEERGRIIIIIMGGRIMGG